MTTKTPRASKSLPSLGVDWKDASVSMFTMDGTILARSKDSTKGAVYEEIVRRSNAFPVMLAYLKDEASKPQGGSARAILRDLGEGE